MSTMDELTRLIARKKKLEAKQKSLAAKVKEAKRIRKEATQYERWTRGLAPIFAQSGACFENKDEFLRYLQWALARWVSHQKAKEDDVQKSQVRTTTPAKEEIHTQQKS